MSTTSPSRRASRRIQNGIVAYTMNQREWKAQGAKVALTATSNVSKESISKWSAKYVLAANYQNAALEKIIEDGAHRVASSLDGGMAVAVSASGCSRSSGAGALTFKRDGATGLYRISSSGGALLTESGDRAILTEADGSASPLWRVSACEGSCAIVSASGMTLDDFAQSTSEGNQV